MTDLEAQRALASFVVGWLDGRSNTDEFVRNYWRTRRALLNSNWSAFEGVFGEVMSSVDSAVDSYRPANDRADFEIDEQQLGDELRTAVSRLNAHLPGILG